MPRAKSKPVQRKRTLNEIAQEAIETQSLCSGVQLTNSSKLSICLNLKPFETTVYSTPDSHSKFEGADLRDADETLVTVAPKPWEKSADQETRAAALQYTATPELFFEKVIKKNAEECAKDTSYPQKSEGWLNARSTAITASDFSSAVCRNPYKSSVKFLGSKVKPSLDSFGSKYTQWGVDHECHADEAFRNVLDKNEAFMYRIDYPNMFKHVDAQWIAVSPDGILNYNDDTGTPRVELIEYKAPAYSRHAAEYPYTKHKGGIPPHYYDQIQGTMWLMRNYDVCPHSRTVTGTFFVVWQPHAMHITFIPYAEEYANELTNKIKKFYFEKLVPSCIQELKS